MRHFDGDHDSTCATCSLWKKYTEFKKKKLRELAIVQNVAGGNVLPGHASNSRRRNTIIGPQEEDLGPQQLHSAVRNVTGGNVVPRYLNNNVRVKNENEPVQSGKGPDIKINLAETKVVDLSEDEMGDLIELDHLGVIKKPRSQLGRFISTGKATGSRKNKRKQGKGGSSKK